MLQRLQSLRVSDVMARQVVQVRACQTLHEVAGIFSAHQISAAPVVDEHGRCVGILSATDFLKRECGPQPDANAVADESQDAEAVPAEAVPLEAALEEPAPPEAALADTDLVSSCMTATVQSVSPDDPLLTAAELMCTRHIHRLPVLNRRGHPVGVISTMDIVAALLNAVEEVNSRTATV